MSAPAPAAVFFDKDGTLIEDVPYSVDISTVRLAPGAGDALSALAACGFELVVVSNQSGVGRGLFPESALEPVWDRLQELVEPYSVRFAGFYYCPHHPESARLRYRMSCSCRKPQPGLLMQAAAALGLDLSRSWMVGDILDDIEAGRRAGCRTILVDRGHETEWRDGPLRRPHHRVAGLGEAGAAIVSEVGA